MRIGLMVNGYHGYCFLKEVIKDECIAWVTSYRQWGMVFNTTIEVEKLCNDNGVEFIEDKKNLRYDADRIFMIGWQYMVDTSMAELITMHDSLLPDLRGFNPTVTSIIRGRGDFGVTALRPSDEPDAGEIIWQSKVSIEGDVNSIKIKDVYEKLAPAYKECFDAVNSGKKMDIENADPSFSMWRDFDDYRVDWSQTATVIVRTINAVGFPYQGATTEYRDEIYVIADARLPINNDHHHIINPSEGKVFRIKDDWYTVLCGLGGAVDIKLKSKVPLRTRFK